MGTDEPLIFQRLLWQESIQAIKDSIRFNNFQSFRAYLRESLPQNSSYVRVRYTRSVIRWFFPNYSLDVLPAKVWRSYHDDSLLQDIMRYCYLAQEPVVAEFVTEHLLPLAPGTLVDSGYFKNFLRDKYGVVKKDPLRCLRTAVRDLGFIHRNKKDAIVQNIRLPKTALLILTHHIFTSSPQTVSLKEIISHRFWKFLGIKEPEEVCKILKEANAKGAITKYIIADQLEQITTKYSLDELLRRRIRL